MAVSAVSGDHQLDRIELGPVHVVRGMTVGADRGSGIAVAQYLPSVHRVGILVTLLGVALAASIRDAEAPFRADRAVTRVHVVSVVAVITGCIGAGLVFPA